MKYTQLIFSPTGGTEKAAKMVTSEWSTSVETVDLTNSAVDFSKCQAKADDLVQIALPSYGGRVAGLAAERLAKNTKFLELATLPGFQDAYLSHLNF